MRQLLFLVSVFLLLQIGKGSFEDILLEEADEDESHLSSLTIHEAPDELPEGYMERNAPILPLYQCLNDAMMYNASDRAGSINRMLVNDTLYAGTPSGQNYESNSYMKWFFKVTPGFATTIKACCWTRIRTTPQCSENKLSLFTTKGYNKGSRYCGWWTHFTTMVPKRLKLVFKSGPNHITNKGFCCRITAV